MYSPMPTATSTTTSGRRRGAHEPRAIEGREHRGGTLVANDTADRHLRRQVERWGPAQLERVHVVDCVDALLHHLRDHPPRPEEIEQPAHEEEEHQHRGDQQDERQRHRQAGDHRGVVRPMARSDTSA